MIFLRVSVELGFLLGSVSKHFQQEPLGVHTPPALSPPCTLRPFHAPQSAALENRAFQGKQSFIHDLGVLSQQLPFPSLPCQLQPRLCCQPDHGTQSTHSEPMHPRKGRKAQAGARLKHRELQNSWAEPVPSSCWSSTGEGARAVPREFSQLANCAEQSWWKLLRIPARDTGVPGREGSRGAA